MGLRKQFMFHMASNILSLKIPNELYFNSIPFFAEQEGCEKTNYGCQMVIKSI